MKRVISVIVLAFLMTEATGINDASLARGQTAAAAQERRAAIARRLSQMDIHSHLKIELNDDTTVDGFLIGVSSDTITLDRLAHHSDKDERRTIAIADIAKVDKARSLTKRILVITGVSFVALVAIGVGACAASYGDMTPTIPAQHRP
jgi:hypothetical protein